MNTIDTSRLIAAKKEEIEFLQTEVDSLCKALQSLDLRNTIGHYHYKRWQEIKDAAIPAAKLINMISGRPGRLNAPAYNAEVFAFLQNLHAICDSVPYVLNILLNRVPIEHTDVGWKPSLLKKHDPRGEDKNIFPKKREITNGEIEARQEFYEKLLEFSKDEIFAQLKGLVNRTKHKHLVPIFYDDGLISFDKYSYMSFFRGTEILDKSVPKNSDSTCENVEEFMRKCHNDLWPKLCSLYAAIAIEKERLNSIKP
ncbi:MAG: hypothetical protein Q8Q81_09440 [Oxalobacteraceae bacterium]|nr:hypothetical protein [Oxalobacteraceae bacterium]